MVNNINNAHALFKLISHGVYVIGVGTTGQQNAFTAAWVMQVSFKPPLLAISINPAHYSYQLLQTGRACSVNVLMQSQTAIAAHFGSSSKDKMAGFHWQTAKTGCPILADSLAYFDCQLSHIMPAGDHHIAVCEVVAASQLNDGVPLLYAQTGDMDASSELYKK
jgi:flavin reductase (DIM6/NTAB) family NADH-FMN oxidoreductase RutF